MQPSFVNRLFWGVVLIGFGLVVLLNQIGLTDIDLGELISVYWPVILIVFGLQGLLLQRSFWNLLLVLIGVVFLGRTTDWIDWSWQQIFGILGPVALILYGLQMIFKGARPGKRKKEEPNGRYGWNPVTPPPPRRDVPPGPPPAPPLSDDPNAPFSEAGAAPHYGPFDAPHYGAHDAPHNGPHEPPRYGPHDAPPFGKGPDPFGFEDNWREEVKRRRERMHHEKHHGWDDPRWSWNHKSAQHHRFIGDIYIGHDYWELKPMNISLFFGDTTLDLTKAQIPVGETKIYVSCFIGDVKVFVPNDPGLGVQVVSSSLIGDVRVWDRKRGGFFNHMSLETPGYRDTDKRIVLVASAFIGDVRVTKVG